MTGDTYGPWLFHVTVNERDVNVYNQDGWVGYAEAPFLDDIDAWMSQDHYAPHLLALMVAGGVEPFVASEALDACLDGKELFVWARGWDDREPFDGRRR